MLTIPYDAEGTEGQGHSGVIPQACGPQTANVNSAADIKYTSFSAFVTVEQQLGVFIP